jgi:UDP-GlcNAc:undecaprenyl-phosphate GlcNAc-1-phosphate transferase
LGDFFKLKDSFLSLGYTRSSIFKVIIISMIISAAFTPVAKWIAYKIGAIDVPKDARRMHKKPIPRIGGLAIFLGTIVGMQSILSFDSSRPELIGILIGAIILVIMGAIDDCRPLPAKLKFMVQIIAASIPIYFGIKVEWISNPLIAQSVKLPVLISIAITILWIVGTTNAVNLIDGLDGLAAGTACIAASFIGYIAFQSDQFQAFWIAMAVVGACLGFLPFNFNPAKIFMGDTGSTFLGYMLAIISVQGAAKGYAAIILTVPLLVLGLPIFDTAFAIMRRAVNGKPIMSPDRGHLHHRLIDRGLTQKQTVITMYTISIVLGIFAVMSYQSAYVRRLMVVIAPLIILLVIFMYVKVLTIKTEEPEEEESDMNDKIDNLAIKIDDEQTNQEENQKNNEKN